MMFVARIFRVMMRQAVSLVAQSNGADASLMISSCGVVGGGALVMTRLMQPTPKLSYTPPSVKNSVTGNSSAVAFKS
jgi:hypothetical protein